MRAVPYQGKNMAEEGFDNQPAQLSERELEIVRLVAAGLSNKEIASQLFVSVNTVKVHLRNIFGKIGVQSRTEATMYAVAQGWVIVPESLAGVLNAPEAPADAVELPAPLLLSDQSPPLVIPPLPWFKRVALALIVLLAVCGIALTWPRSAPLGPVRSTEFDDLGAAAAMGANSAPESAWQMRAPMPTARGRLALASIADKLYAIGGVTPEGVTGAVQVYDSQSDTWTAASGKPLPVANIAAAVVQSRIYVPGGYTASGAPTSVVEVYDPTLDQWLSDVAPLPSPAFAYALAEHQQKLYLFGGWNGQSYVAAGYTYDPQTDQWAAIAPMPTVRGFAAAAVLGEAIYVVGGYNGQQDLNVCERYFPKTNQWEACVPLSVGRGGLGLVALADRLYAIGGGWNGYLAFGERYATGLGNKWTMTDTPLVGQWRNMAAATMGSDIYAVGGWNGQSYVSVNVMFRPFPIRIFLPFQSNKSE